MEEFTLDKLIEYVANRKEPEMNSVSFICPLELSSFVWSDVDKIELKEESMILNVPVKCLIKLKRNEQ